MNEDKKKNSENEDTRNSGKKPYVKWIIIYAIAILLIVLVLNFDSFGASLGKIFSAVTPIFFGAIIAYLCNPIFVLFHKKVFKRLKSVKWKKVLSLLLTYLIVFLIIFSLLFVIADQIVQSVEKFIGNLDGYIASAESLIIGFIDKIDFPEINGTEEPSDTTAQDSVETTPAIPEETDGTPASFPDSTEERVNIIDISFTKEGIIAFIHDFITDSKENISEIGKAIIDSGTATVNFIFNVFLGFIFSVYMLAEKDLIIAKSKKLAYTYLKKERADALCEFGNYADEKVGHFIKGKLIESTIVGIMAYVAFLIFEIPAPLMIAVLVAIMNIIPIFGPFLGAVPAALLVLIMEPAKTIPYIIIVVIIMQINGNYISPKIAGKRTGLTPLGAIIALTLMSGYFGIVGMFIGIPLCAIVVETLWRESNRRLEEKNMPTDLTAYYPSDALVEKDDGKPHNITALIVNAISALFCKIFRINRNKKKDNNIDGTSNSNGDNE